MICMSASRLAAGSCPAYCSVCTIIYTLCLTNETDPFPATLDPKTESLDVQYRGNRGFSLTVLMISQYPSLRELKITGNLAFVEDRTFESSTVKTLTIQHSKLSSLPNRTFGTHSKVEVLYLNNNPSMNVVPFNIFHSLRELAGLDLSYNNFPVCENKTIGEDFSLLPSLRTLNLAGLGSQNPDKCKNINGTFLKSLSQVRNLNLSETAFFHGAQTVLRPLTNLVNLTINNVAPYYDCPALVKSLFENLSDSIQSIEARAWRTHKMYEPNCTISRETLSGLAKLKALRTLDFKYSDRIFGSTLPNGLFQGLKHLHNLELGWCRITAIESGALGNLTLNTLELNGNPLGPQEFWASGPHQALETLHNLVLRECGIDSDQTFPYDASYILLNFPSLHTLDMSGNFMFELPTFSQFLSNAMLASQSELESLDLHVNAFKHLREKDMTDLCQVFPNLRKLHISRCYLSIIEKLCPSITELYAQENRLHIDATVTFKSIKALHNLTILCLDDNSLTSLPANLFDQMHNLSQLSLTDNKISFLDTKLFLYNSHLQSLILSTNLLESVDAAVFQNVTRLETLHLNTNRIAIFDQQFLDYLNATPSLTSFWIEGNLFDCSCTQLYFQAWVKHSNLIQHKNKLLCHQPFDLQNQTVVCYQQPILECYIKWVFVALAGLVGVVLLMLVVYRVRWYLAHLRFAALSVAERLVDIKQQDECNYDALVIFNSKSHDDTNWVKKLMIELEGGDYPQPINLNKPDGRVRYEHLGAK